MTDIFWCTTCLNASTRPRISFDPNGRCNACVWSDKKKNLDWAQREHELTDLLDKHRKKKGFDCLVPVSGGKDGSYVAVQLKKKYGMNPLTVTVTPALALEIGNQNLENFINSGFDHVRITPNPKVLRQLNKNGMVHMGFPYYGWLIAIQSAVLNLAVNLNIDLIFYGEDGEVEYGGSNQTENSPYYNVEYMKKIYLEGGHDKLHTGLNLSTADKYWYEFPEGSEKLDIVHWSYFENWDPYRNYLVAKNECGLIENNETNSGTFTNFAQNDQALYSLHAYFMYLKFGFGRATQDAGIEIRRGALTREQALRLVQLYDGIFPEEFHELYLDYFELSNEEFLDVINSYANKNLFKVSKGHLPEPEFTVI